MGNTSSVYHDELEENKELERMIHQSFIRRSTEFDGNNTPMLADEIYRRRPSSARSRESFFIPHIFKRDTIAIKDDKITPDSNQNLSNPKSKIYSPEDKSSSSNIKLKAPAHPRGDQTSMTNVHSVFEEKIVQKGQNRD